MSWTRSLWGFEHWSRQGDKELTPVTWTIAYSRGLMVSLGFPGGSVVKNLSANARNAGLIPGWGRFPGEGNGKLLQYSCLENSMDRGTWQAIVHGVATSWTQLSDWEHIYSHQLSILRTIALHNSEWWIQSPSGCGWVRRNQWDSRIWVKRRWEHKYQWETLL